MPQEPTQQTITPQPEQQSQQPQAPQGPSQQINNYYGGGSGGHSGGGSYVPEGPETLQQLETKEEITPELTSLETKEEIDYSNIGFEEPAVVIENQTSEINETPIVDQVPVVEPTPEPRRSNTGAIVGGSLAALGAAGAVAFGIHQYNKNNQEYNDEEDEEETSQYTSDDSGNY